VGGAAVRAGVTFRRRGDYATRTLGAETVVVPIRAHAADLDSVYTLNPVGAAIWAELEGVRTAEEIADRVTAEFEVPADVARRDVASFLSTLLEAGIIEELAP
jgi:hypothetical protein